MPLADVEKRLLFGGGYTSSPTQGPRVVSVAKDGSYYLSGWTLRDNEGNTVRAERMLRPHFCLRNGLRHDADASILPPLAAAA